MKTRCLKKKYNWNTRKIQRSVFRTLQRAKQTEKAYKSRKSVGFSAISSLKSMGRIPRSNGCIQLGPKYDVQRH